MMNKTQKTIWTALEEHGPLSMLELHLLTGLSKDGIRGRISELRKMGYKAEMTQVTSKKYVLSVKPLWAKIIALVKEEDLWGKELRFMVLAVEFDVRENDIADAMHIIYKSSKYAMTQITNNRVRLYTKEMVE